MKALIVDDNIDFCRSFVDMLTSLKINAEYKLTPNDAREYIMQNYWDINLVFLDIDFGPQEKESGLDILEFIRKNYFSISVVMVSSKGTIETAVKATKLGAVNFIEKSSLTKTKLQDVINSISGKTVDKSDEESIINFLKNNGIIGKSNKMIELGQKIIYYGRTDLNILITGETGTGKELVARAIHNVSPRKNYKFFKVDLPNIQKHLFQSELFGHIKGAFTGAMETRKGIFQEADKGTIFFDEIGELTPEMQSNLLNPIEYGIIRKVGSTVDEKVNIRFISATDRDLTVAIQEKKFREQLLYRIREAHIEIPPLRERREDIPYIIDYYVTEYNHRTNRQKMLSNSAIDYLTKLEWHGNVRELKNLLRNVLETSQNDLIEKSDIIKEFPPTTKSPLEKEFETLEKNRLIEVLTQTNGNVSKAAAILDVSRRTVYNLLEKYKLDPKDFRKS